MVRKISQKYVRILFATFLNGATILPFNIVMIVMIVVKKGKMSFDPSFAFLNLKIIRIDPTKNASDLPCLSDTSCQNFSNF